LQAEKMFARAFPNNRLASTIVLVLHRDTTTKGQLQRDLKFIDDMLEPDLRAIAKEEGGLAGEINTDEPLFGDDDNSPAKSEKRSIIARIHTPNASGAGVLLVSPDHRALKVPPGVEIAMTDSAVIGRDRTRAQLQSVRNTSTLTIVLVIVLPVYLLLSVLFSYYATLGVSFAAFWMLDPHGFTGIDWKVAIFLFTILIAVGEDYNIFLITRVGEEEREFGALRGITEALDRTGPIISSCGIIMAGTFASLLAGSLTEMMQLGFALSFGVARHVRGPAGAGARLFHPAPQRPTVALAGPGQAGSRGRIDLQAESAHPGLDSTATVSRAICVSSSVGMIQTDTGAGAGG
jgi:uncharacterized membrane protein YdfJ with MMPL/SSD domain